jgi:hypothetical protein
MWSHHLYCNVHLATACPNLLKLDLGSTVMNSSSPALPSNEFPALEEVWLSSGFETRLISTLPALSPTGKLRDVMFHFDDITLDQFVVISNLLTAYTSLTILALDVDIRDATDEMTNEDLVSAS